MSRESVKVRGGGDGAGAWGWRSCWLQPMVMKLQRLRRWCLVRVFRCVAVGIVPVHEGGECAGWL